MDEDVRVDEGGGNVPPPASILEDAQWYATNHRKHVDVQSRLRNWALDHGPVRLQDGSGKAVGLYSDGNEWDHRGIANDFPNLIQRQSIRIEGTPDEFSRAVSLIAEEVPTIVLSDDKYDIDRDAANGVLKSGGNAATALRQHIHAKPGRLDTR